MGAQGVTSPAERLAGLDRRVRNGVIGGVRILVASMWVANLHWKVPPDFGEPTNSGLYKFFDGVTRNSPFAPFTWVVEQIVLPNFQLFGWFTLVAELAVATLLLVGYRTRVVALAGAAITVPILLSVVYYDRADEWVWAYFLMIGVHLLLYAVDAGRHVGLDGVLGRDPGVVARALVPVGAVATVIGLLGLYVARSVAFVGAEAALLGSDAGFVDADGRLVRRWELKLMWFNPSWALLSIVAGVLLIVGARVVWSAYAGAAIYGLMAVVVFATGTFDYLRDDGVVQVVATAPNAAVWGALALAGALVARRSASASASVPPVPDP